LVDALKANTLYPLHMPGHKRNPQFCLSPELWQDITEIPGFDDLHNSTGLIANIQELAAELYSAKKSFLLVNGSTCGNLAAIRALHRQFGGSEMIIIGEPHRSTYHAGELCGLKTVTWESARDAKICVLTSPSYNGKVLDIAAIALKCRQCGIVLHVDAAHGAHLGFAPYFPENPTRLGADTAVESLHKTLPALGQTSLLHICSDSADTEEIARQLDIFETSSPSYILMASAEHCLRLLQRRSMELFRVFSERLRRFYGATSDISAIRQPNETIDPSRIVIYGKNVPKLLRDNGFEPELITDSYTILITTICDEDWVFDKLTDIFQKENLK
jgi:arginine/lysine/ornithine decarboxylase